MVLKLLVAGLIVMVPLLTACSDRFRDPCGVARPATPTTAYRTKNKALGWVPSSTIYFGPSTVPAVAQKC